MLKKARMQRMITTRILDAAPNLKYVAFYHSSDERFNACMRDYEDRTFVYVLTVVYHGEEHFLYVGKSKAQYSRCLLHNKRYDYDHIYLFECASEVVLESEASVIRELRPLFNRAHNPEWKRNQMLLGIDYNAIQNKRKIHKYLKQYEAYNCNGLFGFVLPLALFAALKKEALQNECSCSEYVQRILEDALASSIVEMIESNDLEDTNLVNTKIYAEIHGRSEEQIKQYLRQKDRVSGARRIGRNWVIPRDSKFPDDHRGKRRKNS